MMQIRTISVMNIARRFLLVALAPAVGCSATNPGTVKLPDVLFRSGPNAWAKAFAIRFTDVPDNSEPANQ